MDTKLTERRSLWDTLIDIDTRKMAAAEKEDAEAQAVMSRDADTSGWDAELRELHKTAQRGFDHGCFGRSHPRDLSGGRFGLR